MKKYLFAAFAALALPSANAAIGLGSIQVLSKVNSPLRIEIAVSYEKIEELQGLLAGMASKAAQSGAGKKEWEKALSFSLVERNGRQYLVAVSEHPFSERAAEVTVGIENLDGKVFKDYSWSWSGKGWKIDSGQDVALASPQAADIVPRPKDDIPLKVSTELHHVLPFPVGQVELTTQVGVKSLKNLTEVAGSASRIQLKGWAGKQGSDEKRVQMAFSRAYFVKSALIKHGVSREIVRIMRPDLALFLLDKETDATPRVIATLIAGDAAQAAVDDEWKGVGRMVLGPVLGAPEVTVPLQLARTLYPHGY